MCLNFPNFPPDPHATPARRPQDGARSLAPPSDVTAPPSPPEPSSGVDKEIEEEHPLGDLRGRELSTRIPRNHIIGPRLGDVSVDWSNGRGQAGDDWARSAVRAAAEKEGGRGVAEDDWGPERGCGAGERRRRQLERAQR